MKVEKLIYPSQFNMSVEEYSLSMYSPSLVSNPRDEISRFLTGVADFVKEECRMTIIHNYMNIYRLLVYAQTIEDSKLLRIKDILRWVDTIRKTNLGLNKGF